MDGTALIVFGLQIVMTVIVVLLLVWIMEVTGIGKFMVGRALVLSRLHTLGKMSLFTARWMGNQLCRNMARLLTQIPNGAAPVGCCPSRPGHRPP